jgi:hypothetical protein
MRCFKPSAFIASIDSLGTQALMHAPNTDPHFTSREGEYRVSLLAVDEDFPHRPHQEQLYVWVFAWRAICVAPAMRYDRRRRSSQFAYSRIVQRVAGREAPIRLLSDGC